MNKLPTIPQDELKLRLSRLQQALQVLKLDGALITHHTDRLYFAGSLQNGAVFVPKQGEPTFYIKKSKERVLQETIFPVDEMGKLKEIGQQIEQKYGRIERLGIAEDVTPYKWVNDCKQGFHQVSIERLTMVIRRIRAVKSTYELENIRQSAKKVDAVMRQIPQFLKVGMTELDLVAEIEYHLRKQGNYNLYRVRGYNQELVLGMVAAGERATVPSFFDGPASGLGLSVAHPQSASMHQIEANQPILIDIGATTEGYLIDQTRVAVIGCLSEQLEHAYHTSGKILRRVESLIKPGMAWEVPYLHALEIATEEGLGEHFMGFGADQVKFLGHGIGLEIDELPILAKGFSLSFEPGMVIAIEPKFTFPGIGVVGIENSYVVETDGLHPLTETPEDIITI
ncbi:Xaa-Pro aminopeptidase [Seinonella peptonophila]|uniref:Xaa-Pro aminopeptidase n=1 Tax=Seinonella peptonophila TaxID=112248 RepID=A0A1M4U8T8_9BACL|nr:Xaa-Pro peptidase family protein [Seinonella peptonophila]SHE53046.1 Xaa-Pro aminopeptidase [Seinonella peptonophila]